MRIVPAPRAPVFAPPLLTKAEYLDEQRRVAGYMGPNHMVTPEMNPRIAGAQREVCLHHSGATKKQHDKNHRERRVRGGIVARPVFGEVHRRVSKTAENYRGGGRGGQLPIAGHEN